MSGAWRAGFIGAFGSATSGHVSPIDGLGPQGTSSSSLLVLLCELRRRSRTRAASGFLGGGRGGCDERAPLPSLLGTAGEEVFQVSLT